MKDKWEIAIDKSAKKCIEEIKGAYQDILSFMLQTIKIKDKPCQGNRTANFKVDNHNTHF